MALCCANGSLMFLQYGTLFLFFTFLSLQMHINVSRSMTCFIPASMHYISKSFHIVFSVRAYNWQGIQGNEFLQC